MKNSKLIIAIKKVNLLLFVCIFGACSPLKHRGGGSTEACSDVYGRYYSKVVLQKAKVDFINKERWAGSQSEYINGYLYGYFGAVCGQKQASVSAGNGSLSERHGFLEGQKSGARDLAMGMTREEALRSFGYVSCSGHGQYLGSLGGPLTLLVKGNLKRDKRLKVRNLSGKPIFSTNITFTGYQSGLSEDFYPNDGEIIILSHGTRN